MNIKRKLLTLLFLLISLTTQATILDTLETRKTAEIFFAGQKMRSQHRIPQQTNQIQLCSPLLNEKGNSLSARIYSRGSTYVVVAADDKLPSVLGYGTLTTNDLPQGMYSLLNAYTHASQINESANDETFLPKGRDIAPLLPMVRHQEAPYNAMCPYILQADSTWSKERSVVGCVATALEEIITYHGRNITLQDTLHGWTTPFYTIEDVMPGTSVDVSLILNDYDTENASTAAIDAVARLSFYCGMAAHMNWGLNESGAYIRNLIEPLQRAFGWNYVHYADSYRYSPTDWINMIVTELEAKRPVLYTGYTSMIQGHAFVVDGLNKDGLFHINWGYGGNYDGYFRLDVLAAYEDTTDRLDAQAAQGFFCNQEMLLLHPDAVAPILPDTLERTETDIIVDSIVVERTPIAGIYTPVSIYVRNNSNKQLTTPFELLTNQPTDTARFEQADYIALSGVTLQPGEHRKLSVPAMFTLEGERLLSISPDDICLLYECPVNVLPAKKSKLSFEVNEPLFHSPTSVSIIVTAHNDEEAEGRCGELYRAFFDQGDTCRNYEGATQKADFLYLEPGESRTDTFTYANLEPSKVYTFRMAYSWHTIKQMTFTMPEPASINNTIQMPQAQGIFMLDGRRLEALPQKRGIYIQNGKKIFLK